jgi:biopolymer transport protein TolQ
VNDELSLWALIWEASFVVQMVMLTLFLASVVSWGMIVQRALLLNRAKRQLHDFEQTFWSGIDLGQLYRDGSTRLESSGQVEGVENLFRAGFKEFTRLRQQPGIESDAIMEGAQRAMRVALSREEEYLEKHLPFLATVGSTSPYIGLFGTVWGIMHSFRSLANMHQATLATVAPGISEALIATAMGLFAAIPAVIAYNRYSARVENLASNYETFAEEFSSILHRQAHAMRKSAP